MDKFIFALNKKTKEKLLSMGYQLLQEQINSNTKIYVFENNRDDNFTLCNFSKSDYILSNTLFF